MEVAKLIILTETVPQVSAAIMYSLSYRCVNAVLEPEEESKNFTWRVSICRFARYISVCSLGRLRRK